MSERQLSTDDQYEPGRYEIRIKGQLNDQWSSWFGDLILALDEDGNTLLTGLLADQAALYGLLRKVRDLGMPLISVNRIEPDQADVPDLEQ